MIFNILIRDAENNYKTITADGITQPKAPPYNNFLLLHYNDGRITDLIEKDNVIRITTE